MARPERDHERQAPTQGDLDGRLLLSRLNQMMIRGEDLAAYLQALSTREAWKNLELAEQLAWARLAQAAGGMDTAIEILEECNRVQPDYAEAWEARIRLLEALGRVQESAEVVKAARTALGEKASFSFSKAKPREVTPPAEEDVDVALAPFEARRSKEVAYSRYLELFAGREDCFARQWADKGEARQGYVPFRRPMTAEDLEDHLKGAKTYGIYLLCSDSTVKTAVIDVDLVARYRHGKLSSRDLQKIKREGLWVITRLREVCKEKGLGPLIEFSGGKGFHFWFFFDPPIQAGHARRILNRFVSELRGDVSAFGFEVFPKQETLTGKGFGNLVKLPLGIHRLTGKRSRFLQCPGRGVDNQLAFLETVTVIGPAAIKAIEEGAARGKVVVHPRMRNWAAAWPELAALERKCPPLGQQIAACREGRPLGMREEKVLYQTIGFLKRSKTLMHGLLAPGPEYNPHLVDYRLSSLRGKPLGCKRIHRLLQYDGDLCPFDSGVEYANPLLHLDEQVVDVDQKAEKAENLGSALENLKLAISQVQRFLR